MCCQLTFPQPVYEAVGQWEKDHKQRSKPQAVNLANQMDPVKVNATAVRVVCSPARLFAHTCGLKGS